MKLDGKTVQMANVQWAKVMVESVVQECVVNGKVERWWTG